MKTKTFGYLGGTFSKNELAEARQNGNPLTLDMAIPGNCLNECIFCGYKDTQTGDKLSLEEIKRIIDDFSDLGGRSVKILGEGEPLLRQDILELLDYVHQSSLQPILFTCGDVLGDDNLAQKIHGISGLNVAKRLNDSQTTIMLKYEAKNQDDIVQRRGFSEKRNLALERLVQLGFNKHSPSRLGFGIVVLNLNYDEIPQNYEWAIQNNVYPLLCPLMPIGKASDPEYRKQIGITQEQIVELSARLYRIAQANGIQIDCPADFPGGLPCDISRAGFYIGDTGDIYVCESEDKVGNTRTIQLKDAWKEIKQLKDNKYGENRWSGFCYQKRKCGILPSNFDKLVSERLR